MSEDYLWNGSGPPDPDVERLERLLGPFRSEPPVPAVAPPARWRAPRVWLPALAVAAVLLLAVAVGRRPSPVVAPAPVARTAETTAAAATGSWAVDSLEGSPVVGDKAVSDGERLSVGSMLRTDARSRARISADDIGEVVVEPGSRVRLVASGGPSERLALERGALQAFIVAPAGRFVVETPSATAVDLGCVYTLRVGDNGDGVLAVAAGWVAFELGGRESFVPAGASCPTSAARGPGLPRFDDASAAFVRAIDRVESAVDPAARAAALPEALKEARPRDAMTLWHLLPRVTLDERRLVVRALHARVPLPDGVTADSVLRLDREALDRWWDALGHGDVRTWREWMRPLPLGGR